MAVHPAFSKLGKSFGNPSNGPIFLTEFSTSRVLSTVFGRAIDCPSVEREILTILVRSLYILFDLSFREVVKLLQGVH